MKTFHNNKSSGFTLIEILVVTAMLAVVVGAVYSLYLTHLRAAYSHDEVVEVQQNLRIAMDAISRDLKMAGLMVPKNTTTSPLSNTAANSLDINTTSPNGGLARITSSAVPSGKYTITSQTFSLFVDSPEAVDRFNVNDRVRILNISRLQPLDNKLDFMGTSKILIVTAVHRGDLAALPLGSDKPFITLGIFDLPALTPTATVPVPAVELNPGDVITQAAPTGVGGFDGYTYRLVSGAANNCPVDQCLARQRSTLVAPTPEEIIASNLTQLQFDYLMDNTASTPTVSAVRVTLRGATARNTGAPGWIPQIREMTSIIKLRN